MAINKVIYGSQTLIDLTSDTVSASRVLAGDTFHSASGEVTTGTCDFDVNSSSATATVGEILATKTAYARGAELVGTMPNNGEVELTISAVNQEAVIPNGYHDGSGKAKIAAVEQAKIIAGNIKQGVTILGVTGTLEPSSSVTAQSKSITPSTSEQTVLPDEGYDYLSQVTVAAIPYATAENAAGGTTVTIGGAA